MKKKKIFICMLTVLAALTCVSAVGCDDGLGSSSSNIPQITVDIQQDKAVLDVLSEATLNVLTEDISAEIVWSSSNESVATVKNGVVTALGVGTATITATVNGVSDTCTVEVLPSNDAPSLSISRTQVSIDKGSEYTLTASVSWLGKDVTDKVKLDWTLGSGSQEGIATITPKENGEAVVKGISVGEAEFYVSIVIGDTYVNQKISIMVCDSTVWFDSKELSIGDNGNFFFQMLAIDEDGNASVVDIPTIQAYRDSEEIKDVEYTWSSMDESIVTIEGDKLVAQRAGSADVRGIYDGNEVIVTVLVNRAIIHLEEKVSFELADLKPVALNTQIAGTGNVYCGDVKLGALEEGAIVLDESSYPTTSRELGERELRVETDKASYTLTAYLYSMLIETAEELNAWHTHAFEHEDNGYYALANNIDYNGVYTGSRPWDKTGYKWANPDMVGFKGIFDGNGYMIDGMRIEEGFRGFVTLLHRDAIIRNIAFTNASHSAISAYVCQWGCGTIENVYVQYAENATTGYWDKNSAFGGVFMATDNPFGMTGTMTIKNCFVDASQTMLTHYRHSYIGGYMKKDKSTGVWSYDGAYAKLNDVYVVGPNTISDGSDAHFVYNDLVDGSTNYGLYPTAAAMAADSMVQTIISQWDSSFWGIKNGMPTPLSVIERGDPVKVTLPTSSYYTIQSSMSAYVGKDYTFTILPTNVEMADFIVTVNGDKITPNNGVYIVKNVQGALDINVVHGYIDVSGKNNTTATYNKATDVWKLSKAVLASYEGVREHGNAYISKEYIEYMMSQGYKKLQFTIKPDGVFAVQACYKYNGKVYLATTTGASTDVTVDLTVASELEFWGQNSSGSGSAIKETDSYLTISGLTFSK